MSWAKLCLLVVGCSIALLGPRELFALDCSENGSATTLSSWQARCTACGGTVVGSGSGMHCAFSPSAPSMHSGTMEDTTNALGEALGDALAKAIRRGLLEERSSATATESIRPSESTRLNNRGVELCNAKRYEESLPYFQKALELQPGDGYARQNLDICRCEVDYERGVALLSNSDYAAAAALFSDAVERCGSYPGVSEALPVWRDNLQRAKKAVALENSLQVPGERRQRLISWTGLPEELPNQDLAATIDKLPAAPLSSDPIDASSLSCAF